MKTPTMKPVSTVDDLRAQRDRFRAEADAARHRLDDLKGNDRTGIQVFARSCSETRAIIAADDAWMAAEAGYANAARLVRLAEDLAPAGQSVPHPPKPP